MSKSVRNLLLAAPLAAQGLIDRYWEALLELDTPLGDAYWSAMGL